MVPRNMDTEGDSSKGSKEVKSIVEKAIIPENMMKFHIQSQSSKQSIEGVALFLLAAHGKMQEEERKTEKGYIKQKGTST